MSAAPRVSAPVSVRGIRHPLLVPVTLGLVATAVSLIAIGVPSIWYDEAATITSATRSWSQLWAEVGTVDAVHFLYYALMHVVFEVFGYTPVTLRVPSAIAVGVATSLVAVLGRQLVGLRFGVIAAIVFALLPRTTWMSGEGRSYAFTSALAVGLTVALVAAMRSPQRRWWVVYGALVILSTVLFIYLALVVVGHAVTVIALASRHTKLRRRWFVTTVIAAATLVPFAIETLGQKSQISWLKAFDWRTVHGVVVEQWFSSSTPFAIAGWVGIVAGTAVVVRSRRSDSRAAVLLPMLVLPTAILLLVTALILPIYTPRYLSLCTPAVALVIASGILAAASRWRPAAPIALLVVIALAVPAIIGQRQPESKEYSSWSQVADLIAAERTSAGPDATTAIIYGSVQLHPRASARVMVYAYPAAYVGTIDVTLDTPAAETGRLWETRRPLAGSLDRLASADQVLLITSIARDDTPRTTAILETDGWHVAEHWRLSKTNVVRYERD